MQRIAHLNFAKGFRGGERQTQLLIEGLSQKGYHQLLLVRKNSTLTQKLSKIPNLTVIEIAKPYFLSLSHVRHVSIIHAHETKGAQFAWAAHKLFHIPYLITRRVDNPIKNNFFNRMLYGDATCNIALSKAIETEIQSIHPASKTTKIPSAYTPSLVDTVQSAAIRSRFHNKFLIGHIGELDNAHKGQRYLIEAVKELSKHYPNLHLLLIGKGKDEAVFKAQALGCENITFVGFVENVADYIAALDLFVFPSLHEGLGSILLDVMQANVPIIASEVGGIVDLIQDEENGLLVPPMQSQAIYERVERLYQDRDLRVRLAKNAKENIHAYSSDAMTTRYETLYREILS